MKDKLQRIDGTSKFNITREVLEVCNTVSPFLVCCRIGKEEGRGKKRDGKKEKGQQMAGDGKITCS